MAGRSRQSHDKRQREKRKAEKASIKRARRQNRDEGPEATSDEPEPDKDALMERFRIINEKHAAGEISKEEFEEENNEILLALGVEVD